MSKTRATWNFRYEKGLVDILRDHAHIPMFKGQNGWTPDGWRSVLEKFTQMYPLAGFSKQQLQEKEKELKGYWKMIHLALNNNSGVGWDDSLSMILAEEDKWKKMINDNAKMARFKKKPFPLYDECTSLYAGSVATGELNFTSIAPAAMTAPVAPVAPVAPAAIPAPGAPPAARAPAAPTSSAPVSDSTSLFDGLDVSSVRNEVQSTGDSLQAASGKRKRNQSHIAASIDGLVELRKVQATKTMAALEEKKKQEEAFSVDKCLDEVDAMPLTDVEKACAMNIFKSEIDREVFMKMKNQSVRLIWLKQEISAISRGHV